jgi:alkylated DNA nucleotide flippase Atl1
LYDDGGVSDPVLDVDEAVFDVVEQIPAGRVSTYGAIGRLIGVGPRRVARALSSGGGAVPWYRVVRADGSAAEPVRVRQLELLAAEGVPMRNGRVDVSAVGWPDRGVLPERDRLPRADQVAAPTFSSRRCVPTRES